MKTIYILQEDCGDYFSINGVFDSKELAEMANANLGGKLKLFEYELNPHKEEIEKHTNIYEACITKDRGVVTLKKYTRLDYYGIGATVNKCNGHWGLSNVCFANDEIDALNKTRDLIKTLNL